MKEMEYPQDKQTELLKEISVICIDLEGTIGMFVDTLWVALVASLLGWLFWS